MNTLVAITVPGVAQMIQVLLLNLIQFDILFTEKWLYEFFEMMKLDLNFEESEETYGDDVDYLKESGFDVKYLLGNLGSTFVFILFYILSFIFLLFFKFAGKYSQKADNLAYLMKSSLMWNFSINFLNSQFTAILIPCFINFNSFYFSNRVLQMSLVLTFLFFGVSLLAIYAFIRILKKAF